MFEIGDKVIYQGADKAAYRREGTVVSIEDKDGQPQLTVELDGGETFTAPIDDWSRKFANASGLGLRTYEVTDPTGKKTVVRAMSENHAIIKVAQIKTGGIGSDLPSHWVAGDLAKLKGWAAKRIKANACTSTNSVVRNAMAAHGVARNADVAVNHKDGYNGIIQAFNKLTEGYFASSRALKSVPDAYSALKTDLDAVYKNIGALHEALEKWDAK